jgi:tetratricopeptide (TPR) repeat protein
LLELAAQVHTGDLAGISQVADRIAKVAAEAPGWQAQHQLAQGYFQRLRGDLGAAKQAFENALALADPERVDPPSNLNAWVSAAAGYAMVLIELGQTEAARSFGLRAYQQCQELQIGGWSAHLIRTLAIAEAKLGDFAGAAARLDKLIAQRAGMMPSRLLLDYDARARVAIWAKDTETAAHYAELAASQYRAGGPAVTRHGRLQEEAKQAGLELEVPMTAFESSVLGGARTRDAGHGMLTKIAAAFNQLSEPSARALRALELLCETSRAHAGQLYVAQDGVLVRAASLGNAPDASLDRFAHEYWQQQLEDCELTMVEVEGANDASALGTSMWTSHVGTEYRFAVLKAQTETELAYVGLVAMAAQNDQGLAAEYWELSTAIGTRLLELGDVQAMSPS